MKPSHRAAGGVVEGMNTETTSNETNFNSTRTSPFASAPIPTHIYVLLDRSGSMESIADDVIGGFNHFVAEQCAAGADARMTLVQFYSFDHADVMFEAKPISQVRALGQTSFMPRGSTPLLDATGSLIRRARKVQKEQLATCTTPEAIVFVTITDGRENASDHYSLSKVRRMVEHYRAAGWTFVYLSAGLDAFGDAQAMGYDVGSVQAWQADSTGTHSAFTSLSSSTISRRERNRTGLRDTSDFFTDTCLESDDSDPHGLVGNPSLDREIRRARWAAHNPGITPPSELM